MQRSRSPHALRSSDFTNAKTPTHENISTPQRAAENPDKLRMRMIAGLPSKMEPSSDASAISSLADVSGISMPSSAVVAALYREREEKRKLMHQLR